MNLSRLRLVGKRHEHDTPLSSVEHSADGSIIVHTTVYQTAPDELIAYPFNIEAKAARYLVRSGKLRAVKIGRRLYARRSDVLALVDTLEPEGKGEPNSDDSYAALVARARRTR